MSSPSRKPRLCLIGNPDSIHVRRWGSHFAGRGFDVHIVSFYEPRLGSPDGVTVDFLRPRRSGSAPAARARTAAGRFPGVLRLVNAARLIRGGFARAVARVQPDIVHAHYVSDYGFLATLARRHPLVVSAWGSDLLLDPHQSLINRRLVRWVLSRSELITYDAEQVAAAARRYGARPERLLEVVLGVDTEFLGRVEGVAPPATRAPVVVSLRSLERPMYNVDAIVRAMPAVLRDVPDARLLVGNDGGLRPELEKLASELGITHAVDFLGVVDRVAPLADLLGRAAVYVSVPSSDGTSVTLLEAMAAGAYPVVSDLPSNREWIDGLAGEVVAIGDVERLAGAIAGGLKDPGRREAAAKVNQDVVQKRGRWDENMTRMESAYRSLLDR